MKHNQNDMFYATPFHAVTLLLLTANPHTVQALWFGGLTTAPRVRMDRRRTIKPRSRLILYETEGFQLPTKIGSKDKAAKVSKPEKVAAPKKSLTPKRSQDIVDYEKHAHAISYKLPTNIPAEYLSKGLPLFTAHGCVLLERQAPKCYAYIAVNLTTGESATISRRTVPLDKTVYGNMYNKAHVNMAVKIYKSAIVNTNDGTGAVAGVGASGANDANDTNPAPGTNVGLSVDHDAIHSNAPGLNIDTTLCAHLSDKQLADIQNTIFTNIFPQHGFPLRENQRGLAEHILQTMCQRSISLAEAGVGIGKTLAYLTAAILAKRSRQNDFWLKGHYPKQDYAASAQMPVVVATSSIALQRAIIQDYIPALSDILMKNGIITSPITCVIRKGKEHFICEKRLRSFLITTDKETAALIRPLMDSDVSCDLADAEALTPFMKRKICVSGQCGGQNNGQGSGGRHGRHFGHSRREQSATGCHFANANLCRYQKYRNDANDPQVDFQITNHNYFLADTIHRASQKRPLLPHYQAVIIDEAHKFLGAARQMYGIALNAEEIPILTEYIHSFTEGKSLSGLNIHRRAKKLEKQSHSLFRRLEENIRINKVKADAANANGVGKKGIGMNSATANTTDNTADESDRFPAVMDTDTNRHLQNIVKIADMLIEVLPDSHVQTRFRERLSQTVWALKNLRERAAALMDHTNLVCWVEGVRVDGDTKVTLQSIVNTNDSDDREPISLHAIPKNLNELLHRDIWSSGIPIILTSGTLSAGVKSAANGNSADFSRTKQSLGLSHLKPSLLRETSMASPFDYAKNSLLYLSPNTLYPNNKDKAYITSIADEAEKLIIAAHGHAAMLFTSYNVMGQVYAILSKRFSANGIPFPLFRMGRRDTTAIDRFKASGNGILLASGSLWEGIDIPGDSLSLLIIVKLPFAVPDPIGDYERSLYGDAHEYRIKVLEPDMLVKAKQGDGRILRIVSDTGVCAFFDIRAYFGAPFHSCLLDALPRRRVTSDIVAVEKFMREHKSAAYFGLTE